MKEIWNDRYSDKDYFYGIAPNPQFKSFIDNNKPGKILLPAEGEGRNAVYAASKGWEVTALDFSVTAKTKALQLAKINQTSIQYTIIDVLSFQAPPKSFDYIACVFMHLPFHELTKVNKHLLSLLKTNGKLLIVGFNKHQLQHCSGGPKNKDWLFSAQQFENEFASYKLPQCTDITTSLSEGKGHTGKAAITVVELIK
ncbi:MULTISPECIES: class I SAM-dependent methyltransferase [unclassified Carboxylicivirga]|uniref:class I SAM-dependent methyltransferase n=1 Tax=Carboxylicivirga TaxID=1628153 RepID=UPI003D333EA1